MIYQYKETEDILGNQAEEIHEIIFAGHRFQIPCGISLEMSCVQLNIFSQKPSRVMKDNNVATIVM